jgi:hypothetical protein
VIAGDRADGLLASLRPGDAVRVGQGRLELAGAVVRVVRVTVPARVRDRVPAPGADARAVGAVLDAALDRVAPALPDLSTQAAAVVGALRSGGDPEPAMLAMAGAGPGLTPSGDDALAGALLVARASGLDVPAAAVAAAGRRTTLIAAHLLAAAAEGHAARPVVDLVDAVTAAAPGEVGERLTAVLALGHTSGADLVAGVRGALAELTAGAGRRPGRLGAGAVS